MAITDVLKKIELKSSPAALKVALGGVFSLLAGMASQVIIAYLFGAGAEMDAYFTAMTIPTYIQYSLLGGLPFVVIPAFVHEETTGDPEDAWALAGSFIWIAGGFLLVVAVLGAVFSGQITARLAPGFTQSKSQLTAQMLSIMMFTIPFLGLGVFTSSIENVRGRFFIPASATAFGSVANFLIILILKPIAGPVALAWGTLASAIIYGCVTILPVLKHGWKRVLNFRDPRLLEMLKLILPFIFFGFVRQGKGLLERFLASSLPDGQLSYIGYANKISNIFVVLLASSVASTIFPIMARAFSTGGKKSLVKEVDYGLRITFALAMPAVAIVTVVSIPLIQLIYQRGAFDEQTTFNVSVIIPIMMLSNVLILMILNMIGRTFCVLKDTLTTNLVSSLTILVYVVVAYAATNRFGYIGLALAQPIQSGLSMLILSFILFRRLKSFAVIALIKSFFIDGLVSLFAGLAAWGMLQLLSEAHVIFQLALSIGVSGLIYLGLLRWFDPEIVTSILEMTGLEKVFTLLNVGVDWIRKQFAWIMVGYQNMIDLESSGSLFVSHALTGKVSSNLRVSKTQRIIFPNALLMIAFLVGLLSPLFISMGILPGVVRWIADAVIAVMIVLSIFRMLSLNHVPRVFWLIMLFSLIGIFTSLVAGQDINVTLWGWWLMFQYPLVGLFSYLQPRWPDSFPRKFVSALILIAVFEVLVQMAQFLMGEPPGDGISGSLGENGTGRLMLLMSLVLGYSLGEWLHSNKWIPMIMAVSMGLISSVLGEMKMFYPAIFMMCGMAFVFYLLWGKKRWKIIPYFFLIVGVLAIFIPLYDAVVPSADGLPLETYFTNPALLTKYLTFVRPSKELGSTYHDIGRNYAIQYGWQKITADLSTLPFGYGLGARAESRSLGMAGRALTEGELGISAGTSGLVIMQETGLIGLAGLLSFIVVVAFRLFRQIRQQPASDLNPLRYGLLFFTILWPMWLWYNTAWIMRTPMLLYWVILGYVFGENRRRLMKPAPVPIHKDIDLGLETRALSGGME